MEDQHLNERQEELTFGVVVVTIDLRRLLPSEVGADRVEADGDVHELPLRLDAVLLPGDDALEKDALPHKVWQEDPQRVELVTSQLAHWIGDLLPVMRIFARTCRLAKREIPDRLRRILVDLFAEFCERRIV